MGGPVTDHAVVIAGAGPTGLMLAAELTLAGTDVVVVERRTGPEIDGSRAGGLHSRTIEVLDQRGVAERFLDEGQTAHGGRIPVNVSGGLLSKGHPLGATGVANVYEIATHLRGEAGERQVAGAKVGLAHVIGLGSACGIHILEKTA